NLIINQIMKSHIIAAFFLLLPFSTLCQTTDSLDGFFGINFGSSKEQALKIMKSKGHKPIVEETDYLGYSDVRFGGRKSYTLLLLFNRDRLFEAEVSFKSDLESKTIDLYKSILEDLEDKYGVGNTYERY